MEHEKRSPRKMFEKFYGKPFEQITPEDIGPEEEIDWGPDVGAERLELYDAPSEITQNKAKNSSEFFGCLDGRLDGMEFQREVRDEWDERDAAIENLLNEMRKEY